jgi:pyrimidine-nucleoside phosphorylase
MASGVVADLSSIRRPKVDKHSTGGVGDKISLPLAPMVVACGAAVPMISGRGLGHTGGTLDKLESIAGFNVNLTLEQYRDQIARVGAALIGQSPELAPADKKLYALRDVTATVESIPLICASIMGKKLAEGIDALVLDVKFGGGAFMAQKAQARELAEAMVAIGRAMHKPVRAVLTAMEQPLGHTVGNALEVAEAIACLHGQGPADVMEVTLTLGCQMLQLVGLARTAEEAREKLERAVSSGAALQVFRAIVLAQGGDLRMVDDPSRLPAAPHRLTIESMGDGYVQTVDARKIALAALGLGAGRKRAEDAIDPAVGIGDLVKIGDPVRRGNRLATVHASSAAQAAIAGAEIQAAVGIGRDRLPAPALIDGVV